MRYIVFIVCILGALSGFLVQAQVAGSRYVPMDDRLSHSPAPVVLSLREAQVLYQTVAMQMQVIQSLKSQLAHRPMLVDPSAWWQVTGPLMSGPVALSTDLTLEQWVILLLASGLLWFVLGEPAQRVPCAFPKPAVHNAQDSAMTRFDPQTQSNVVLDDAEDEYDFLASEAGCASQLDLAHAYLDMGEWVSAREAIDHVYSKGTLQQQSQATRLLARLENKRR